MPESMRLNTSDVRSLSNRLCFHAVLPFQQSFAEMLTLCGFGAIIEHIKMRRNNGHYGY